MFLDREAASAFISEKDNLSGGGFQSQVRDQLNPDPMRQDFAMVCHALAASPICGWVVQDFSALNLGLGRGIAFAKSCSSPGVATTCCS
jgi:hypothetical protein